MSYQALYRKYRPNKFEEVVGQDFIVKTLQNAIKNDQLSHAYLFAGPRGIGKTSVAKLFAKELNCPNEEDPKIYNNHPDLLELDAASNNSVEDIRNIVENINYAPVLGKYKIYIIDEVHMLSNSAFNALLKTLEEPPKNVIFILATTDPQKILATVLSRVQRYNFRPIDKSDMVKRMSEILDKEKIEHDKQSLDLIADLASGGMRDCLSILDQVLVYGENKLEKENIYKAFGILRKELKLELINDVLNGDIDDLMKKARMYRESGIDLKRLTNDLLKLYKEFYLFKATDDTKHLSELNDLDLEKINIRNFSLEYFSDKIDVILDCLNKYKNAHDLGDYFELCLIKLFEKNRNDEVKSVELKENKTNLQVKKEIVKEQQFKLDDESLLSILKKANKEIKRNDLELFKNISDYSLDPDKRRFVIALKDCEIFAADLKNIILLSEQYLNINELGFNKKLYAFFKEDLKLDKMVYAINKQKASELIKLFKSNINTIKDVEIKKHQLEENSLEASAKKMFGNIEIKKE